MDKFWADVLTGLIIAVGGVLVTSGVRYLNALTKVAWGRFENNQPDLAYELEQIATKAVQAAEQSGLGKIGADKKKMALDIAENWLALKGFDIDLHLVDAEIEAAVYREINKDKQAKQMDAPMLGLSGVVPEHRLITATYTTASNPADTK